MVHLALLANEHGGQYAHTILRLKGDLIRIALHGTNIIFTHNN